MKKLVVFLIFLWGVSCTPRRPDITPSPQPTISKPMPELAKRPKNIILMIGDGMGLTQVTAGMYANGNKLNLEKFPITGLHKSYAANNLVTDSAAGATAFSCGVKTYNGAIGVNVDTIPHRTILEDLDSLGYATGMVTTSTIVHATPASFVAHAKLRKMYEEIALDFLDTEIDFFVGGGKKFFTRREMDDRNLYKELISNGYVVSDFTQGKFAEMTVDHSKNFAYFTDEKDPLPLLRGRDYFVSASEAAYRFLDDHSEKGFFLMIEGAQIDWGGHANDSEYVISEMIDFDEAIGKVLAMAEADGETLVIVTADHETGGYAINQGSTLDSLITSFTTDYHTGVMIPVFAYGPGAELFSGIYENTAIYDKMRHAAGLE